MADEVVVTVEELSESTCMAASGMQPPRRGNRGFRVRFGVMVQRVVREEAPQGGALSRSVAIHGGDRKSWRTFFPAMPKDDRRERKRPKEGYRPPPRSQYGTVRHTRSCGE
ncbi:hypothetical protein Sp245p_22660 (plasmid) [Azospirillum baldaniorum]|uniref:Uncharacterized protein n=1 Tax=Azospirillum baldaniorum TaxID=1064539 RepID=A0A9P1JZS6_9PROT|nr:hypothetical protein Sp245p_22660 [Azospirillum baldaniorum]CCD02830.1 protein of unknown function [Azospirillum baldaniorum]